MDNEKELRISLRLCITYDFVMEILSYGRDVKVIQPVHLVQEMKQALQKTFEQYL